jgi:hypothetical protein
MQVNLEARHWVMDGVIAMATSVLHGAKPQDRICQSPIRIQ